VSEGMDVDATYVEPKKRLRYFHQIVVESEVEAKLNELEAAHWDIEDPRPIEGSEVPGHRQYLIYASRKECWCECCQRAARKVKRSTKRTVKSAP